MGRPSLDPTTSGRVQDLRARINAVRAERGVREATLVCLSPASAAAVAEEMGGSGGASNTLSVHGRTLHVTYYDARYPLDLAEWAAGHGHAADEEAARTIGSL